MKKVLLIVTMMLMSSSVSAMLWDGCVFTSLSVSDNGSWRADVLLVHGFPDSLLFVSGSDTARFLLNKSEIADFTNIGNTFVVSGNEQESILKFSGSESTFTGKGIAMSPTKDSLEIFPCAEHIQLENLQIPPYVGDILRYGGSNLLPALGNGRKLIKNNHIQESCDFLGISYQLFISGDNTYGPYNLKGKVYDASGNIVPDYEFYLMENGASGCSDFPFKTNSDGSYTLSLRYIIPKIDKIYYPRPPYVQAPVDIQPITLGKPFGDTINVDIHLLGPLAEGETAPDAVTVQRSGSILHVSGAVREIALIDASGRSLSCTRSAEVDIESLPAGIYYLSVTLADGRVVRHPFNR